MNGADNIGLGQRQDVIVADQILAVIRKLRASKIRFSEPCALHHRTHGAVEYENALTGGQLKLLSARFNDGHQAASLTARIPKAWQMPWVSSARFRV